MPDVTLSANSPGGPPVLHLVPPPGGWGSFASARQPDALTRRTRAQLGLPEQAPLVVTGHQAGIWHAGILAKYLAADALARAVAGAAWTHVIVDQDVNDAGGLPVPTADLRRVTLRLAPASPHRVTAHQPTSARAETWAASIHSQVAARVERILALVPQTAAAPDLASQMVAMVRYLSDPLLHWPSGLRATRLGTTDGFQSLVKAMLADPRRCVDRYNAAVMSVPRARISPLRTHAGRVELPLWRIDPDTGTRHAVFSDEANGIPADRLAPRALLLSAFLRLFVCDLFIHGTGGGLYDQATDSWLRQWQPTRQPCPGAVVSATLTLPLAADGGVPSPEAIARARWEAHAARHDPARLGDATAGTERARLLEQVREAKASGGDPRGAYLRLHALLEKVRDERRHELDAMQARAAALEGAGRAAGVVHDRTWPFPLHSPVSLDALRTSIGREVGREA